MSDEVKIPELRNWSMYDRKFKVEKHGNVPNWRAPIIWGWAYNHPSPNISDGELVKMELIKYHVVDNLFQSTAIYEGNPIRYKLVDMQQAQADIQPMLLEKLKENLERVEAGLTEIPIVPENLFSKFVK